MTILWVNLGLVYIFSTFARYFSKPLLANSEYIRPNVLLTFFSALILILVSGLRINIGDTKAYMNSYSKTLFTWENIKGKKDIGFNIYQMVLQKVSVDPQFIIIITSLITNLIIILVLYKYSRIFELGVYVYITGGLFVTGMNGIRQFLAAAIVFSASKFLFNGNWKAYFLVILIAAQFHNTAYILLPIYFLVRRKAWSASTLFLLIIAIGIVIGFNEFSTVLFSALEDTQYGGYKDIVYGGANIIRVFVYAVPIVIAYFGREKLSNINENSDYIINMCILGFVFMIISTQDWIFARFTFYFGLYNIILISWVTKLFNFKDEKLIYFLIIVFYFLYFYYENVISLNIIYKSNYLDF
ncbi:EpsG family protein [Bacillus sp. ISL-18]|uniref:EpsG family protein n=1 Tax=Bacillus sp. ISL-18 TaxID=2819118 RepID=UPI001BEC3963|nr:EpsG family protein [Bacillus sp. ISL-18]MBT2657083.1 EpsG family protein [Bacillus sp. ISL-18]